MRKSPVRDRPPRSVKRNGAFISAIPGSAAAIAAIWLPGRSLPLPSTRSTMDTTSTEAMPSAPWLRASAAATRGAPLPEPLVP